MLSLVLRIISLSAPSFGFLNIYHAFSLFFANFFLQMGESQNFILNRGKIFFKKFIFSTKIFTNLSACFTLKVLPVLQLTEPITGIEPVSPDYKSGASPGMLYRLESKAGIEPAPSRSAIERHYHSATCSCYTVAESRGLAPRPIFTETLFSRQVAAPMQLLYFP